MPSLLKDINGFLFTKVAFNSEGHIMWDVLDSDNKVLSTVSGFEEFIMWYLKSYKHKIPLTEEVNKIVLENGRTIVSYVNSVLHQEQFKLALSSWGDITYMYLMDWRPNKES